MNVRCFTLTALANNKISLINYFIQKKKKVVIGFGNGKMCLGKKCDKNIDLSNNYIIN